MLYSCSGLIHTSPPTPQQTVIPKESVFFMSGLIETPWFSPSLGLFYGHIIQSSSYPQADFIAFPLNNSLLLVVIDLL